MTTDAAPKSRGTFGYYAIAGGLLAVVIMAMHGRSLNFGWFMDDYAHLRQLRECGWSLGSLVAACRLELNGGVVDMWWLPEVTLRFFRPVAFALMKLAYVLTGWNATAMHACSLGWHWIVCCLLLVLLRRLDEPPIRAWCLAALFALHPGTTACVQWIACQSELMVTAFLLGGTLCFANYRGWGRPRDYAGRPGHAAWAVATVVLFIAALGCRENAIMFPLVLVVGEAFAPRGGRRRGRLLLAALGLTAAVYLLVRGYYLQGIALPPRPYIVPPSDPDFSRFVFDKFLYYQLGEFLFVPIVPITGLPYLRAHPLLFYAAGGAVLAISALLTWRNRCRLSGWVGIVWLAAYMLPVLPAFESPHHLYLPGIGWTLVMAVAARTLGALKWRGQARPAFAGVLGLLCATLFVFMNYAYSFHAMKTAQQVEDRVVDEIVTAPHAVQDGDTLYVANLPMIAHYTQLAVEERTGLKNLRVVPLTWAPQLLGVGTSAELRLVDEHTIEMRVAQDRYFAGPMKLLIREVTGRDPVELLAEPLRHGGFTVELLDADDSGISALRFTFDDALTNRGLHLFWGSRQRWAYQVLPERQGDEN